MRKNIFKNKLRFFERKRLKRNTYFEYGLSANKNS